MNGDNDRLAIIAALGICLAAIVGSVVLAIVGTNQQGEFLQGGLLLIASSISGAFVSRFLSKGRNGITFDVPNNSQSGGGQSQPPVPRPDIP